MHVECREASECGVDVSLRGLFPFVVVLSVKWERDVFRDGVPDGVFRDGVLFLLLGREFCAGLFHIFGPEFFIGFGAAIINVSRV